MFKDIFQIYFDTGTVPYRNSTFCAPVTPVLYNFIEDVPVRYSMLQITKQWYNLYNIYNMERVTKKL